MLNAKTKKRAGTNNLIFAKNCPCCDRLIEAVHEQCYARMMQRWHQKQLLKEPEKCEHETYAHKKEKIL